MIDLIKQNKIMIVAGLIVLAGVAWYVLAGSAGTNSPVLTENTTGAGAQNATERDLLDSLLTLRAIKLDDSVFRDPAFMSLRDFSTQIVSEPIGRVNPFAPLPGMSSSNAAATGTTTSNRPGGFLRSN